jgi:hypothetical protein
VNASANVNSCVLHQCCVHALIDHYAAAEESSESRLRPIADVSRAAATPENSAWAQGRIVFMVDPDVTNFTLIQNSELETPPTQCPQEATTSAVKLSVCASQTLKLYAIHIAHKFNLKL